MSCLRRSDILVRQAVRRWVNLPHDTPTAFFHASACDGGLSIPSIRWRTPLLRYNRLSNVILPNLEGNSITNVYLASERDAASARLLCDGETLKNTRLIQQIWARKLYSAVDGTGLRQANLHPQAHQWILEPSRFLSGRDFVNCTRLRIRALPSRSHTTRGQHQVDRACRAGCRVPETVNHILQ